MGLIRVRRLDQPPPFLTPARDRRYCVAKIDAGKVAMRDRHPRALRHRQLGLEPDQCGVEARFAVDDQPLCERHAGKAALEILIDEGWPLLSFADAQAGGLAMHDRWLTMAEDGPCPIPPLARDDAAWADLFRAAWEAVRTKEGATP